MKIIILYNDTTNSYPILEGLLENYKVEAIIDSGAYIGGRGLIGTAFYLHLKWGLKITIIKMMMILKQKLSGRYTRLKRKHKITSKKMDINSEETLKYLKSMNPDLIISIYCLQKVGKEILSKYKCINTHPAYLPERRGMFSVIRSLRNKDKYTGFSIHYVNGAMDDGEIIKQEKVEIKPDDNLTSLYKKLNEVGRRLLLEVLKDQKLSPHRTYQNAQK